MNSVKHIEIDLSSFKIILHFQNFNDPLILHFDTPSRRFYFVLTALIVHEMRKQDPPGYVDIRKYEHQLKLLDSALAGTHASDTVVGMWEKIRKAWHYSLPNLKEAAHFTIEGRDVTAPHEKGGKRIYDCTDNEYSTWSSLFGIDDASKKWRFKFAFEKTGIELTDVLLKYDGLENNAAWNAFVTNIEQTDIEFQQTGENSKVIPAHKKQWRFPIATVVLLIVFLVSGVTILNRSLRPAPSPDDVVVNSKPSIAVLPFINISDDPDQEYFCDGLTEELINHLASFKDLHVISRTSAFYFKNKGMDLRTIGEKLNVENILEGSVRISGDQLRISAQLIKVTDDSHLWAENYDRGMKDIFDTQENLAKSIACSLKSKLGCDQEELIAKRYTDNVEAYNLYLRGRFLYYKVRYHEAVDYFKRAIATDPNYALAYSGLADAYSYMTFFFADSPEEHYKRAKDAATKAIEIDYNLAEAHASLGKIKCSYDWDWKGAEIDLRRAIELSPNNALAHRFYSSYLRAVGRLDESFRELEIALKLDPLSHGISARLGMLLVCQGKIEEAITYLQEIYEMYPKLPIVQNWLGLAYVDKQMFEEGIKTLKQIAKRTKRKTNPLGFLGYAYGMAGKKSEAQSILNELLQRSEKKYVSPTFISIVYTGMGDKNKAFEWLETAYKQRDPRLYTIKPYPIFKSLHSDPRWSELMRKMGHEG